MFIDDIKEARPHPLASVGIAAGMLLDVKGRYVKIEKIHDNGVLEIIDQLTMAPIQIRSEKSGEPISPTLDWLRERYIAGEVRPVEPIEIAFSLDGRDHLLDPDRLLERDPDARWRRGLCGRAHEAGVPRTDHDLDEWLNASFGNHADDEGKQRPSGSTLKRWIREWLKGKGSAWNMIFVRGRTPGVSQLDPRVDRIVDKWAIWYWATPNESARNAHVKAKEEILARNAGLEPGETPLKVFSEQTMRNRIRRLKCHDTVAAKFGKKHADKLFKGSGEGITASFPLEIGLMDATMLEQTIVFDDDWQLPACRVRIVALMDLATHAIVGFHVYPGPDRSETSIEAVLDAVSPPEVPEDLLLRFPILGWIMGKFSAILPDNAKTLIGPSTLPSFEEAGMTVLMPPIEMPTAKAKLERWFGTLKTRLRTIPGTLIDPKRAVELDYDPVAEACLTLPQLRKIIARFVAEYNSTPQKSLDGRSPAEVWAAHARRRALPVFEDRARLARIIGRTATALLTRNGIEKFRLRWRDAVKCGRLLDNMAGTDKAYERNSGDLVVEVRIRWNPGNLDAIQVFDEVDREWIELPSTRPLYTKNLSEWEHEVYRRAAKRRGEAFETERDMIASRAATLREIDEMAPKLPFQRRGEMAALYVSESVKKLRGRETDNISDIPGVDQRTSENDRRDDGLPRVTPKSENKRKSQPAPARAEGYYSPIETALDDDDWVFGDEEQEHDAEIGREDPIVDEDLPPEDDR